MSGFNPLPLIILIILAAVYLAPAFIAWRRQADGLRMIVLLDILLGWTMVGWILALVLACVYPVKKQ